MSSARCATPTTSAAIAARTRSPRHGRAPPAERLGVAAADARVAARRVDRLQRRDVGAVRRRRARASPDGRRAARAPPRRRRRRTARACRCRRSPRRTPDPAASAPAAHRCRGLDHRGRRRPSTGTASPRRRSRAPRAAPPARPRRAPGRRAPRRRRCPASRAPRARPTARASYVAPASAASRTRAHGERAASSSRATSLISFWSSVRSKSIGRLPRLAAGRARARRRCS